MPKTARYFLIIITSMILIMAACLAADLYLNNDFPLVIGVISAGLFIFPACIYMAEAHDTSWISDPSLVRATIALAIVCEYLVLVGTVAFFNAPNLDHLPLITQTLVSNFTTIVGVVIASYFGASAYIQAQERKSAREPMTPNSSNQAGNLVSDTKRP